MADILKLEMNLPKNIPKDLSGLLDVMVTDFSAILRANLVGIYLWGSLTYEAFDEACSDVDCIGVTRRDLDEREFSELDDWLRNKGEHNRWVQRIDMRFVVDQEFLDKSSRCCGFYPYTGRLVRHGSDGNPIIWMNIGSSGIDALLLELNYLKEDLASKAGDRSDKAFVHNSYAVLTACRILYSAHHRALVSKDQAYGWAIETVSPIWRATIHGARENRLKHRGLTTAELEQDAQRFVDFVAREVKRELERSKPD